MAVPDPTWPVDRERRHSRIWSYREGKSRRVGKQYTLHAQFQRELRGYERLLPVVDRVMGAACPDIIAVDHEKSTIVLEYIEGAQLARALGSEDPRVWSEAWSVVERVLVRATQEQVAFDCDPTNILIAKTEQGPRVVFLDPECIEERFHPYSASVFFVGCFKVFVKCLLKPTRASKVFRRWRRAMVEYLQASGLRESQLGSGMRRYALLSAHANRTRGPNEGILTHIVRALLMVPFWRVAAVFFRFVP